MLTKATDQPQRNSGQPTTMLITKFSKWVGGQKRMGRRSIERRELLPVVGIEKDYYCIIGRRAKGEIRYCGSLGAFYPSGSGKVLFMVV